LGGSRGGGCAGWRGRGREPRPLEGALREAEAGRSGVILNIGEPGAGKSRLCHELVERSRGVPLYQVRSLSHGRMLPFHALAELARGLFGVHPSASAAHIRTPVKRGLSIISPV